MDPTERENEENLRQIKAFLCLTVFLLVFWRSEKSLSLRAASLKALLHSMCSCAIFSFIAFRMSHDVFRLLQDRITSFGIEAYKNVTRDRYLTQYNSNTLFPLLRQHSSPASAILCCILPPVWPWKETGKLSQWWYELKHERTGWKKRTNWCSSTFPTICAQYSSKRKSKRNDLTWLSENLQNLCTFAFHLSFVSPECRILLCCRNLCPANSKTNEFAATVCLQISWS